MELSSWVHKQEGPKQETHPPISDDECESSLLSKMTKALVTGTCQRGEGLLAIIHIYMSGPFRSAIMDANHY